MIKVKRIINNNNWKLKADDEITLDSLDRNRRRIALITKKKVAFLLDQKKTVFLNNGALLVLSNEYKVKVKAKLEEVLKVETNTKQNLSVLAWHIGNRHIPAEIHNNYILIKRDAVISKMLKLLGAKVLKKKLSFTPEPGAYHNN
mgnify:CR=1 FL=1|tara:strand:+ start:22 stop:456 length:435 start_codon:yes stop_codon:yes gene_type:complete